MKSLLNTICTMVLTLALAGCASVSTPAAPPATASGNWTDCNLQVNSQSANGDTIVTVTITETFSGALAGNWVGTEWDVVHADNSGTFQGVGVFTGSADQHSGSAVMSYAGTFPSSGPFKAQWTIDNGSDGLQNVHGQGTFGGTSATATKDCAAPYAGTYSGQIQVNP